MSGKGDDAVFTVRRLFTPEERKGMGEIENLSYALIETGKAMMQDLSSYKFYDKVASDAAYSSNVRVAGWRLMEPELVAGTKGIDKHGNLAGKYVHPDVYADLKRVDEMNKIADNTWAKGYRQIMQGWKATKTIYNPVVHTNNMMSNVVMYDGAGGTAKGFGRAVKSFAKKDKLYEAARRAGAFDGGSMEHEAGDIVAKALASNNMMAGGMAPKNIFQRSTEYAVHLSKKTHTGLTALYQAEDSVFRMGLFITRKGLGDTDEQAAAFARKHLIDYEINAPAIQALRQTALPFFSYTYRVAPLLAEMAIRKPWKAAKWLALPIAVNELGESSAISDGKITQKEIDTLKRLEKEDSPGIYAGLAPNKVYLPGTSGRRLDISRFAPGGDVFGTAEQGGLLSGLPAPLSPSFGPLGAFVAKWQGTDPFTGQDIPGSKLNPISTFVQGMVKEAFPNNILLDPRVLFGFPSSYSSTEQSYISKRIERAYAQQYKPTEEKYTVAEAVISALGFKISRADLMRQETLDSSRTERTIMDITEEMSKASAEFFRDQLTPEEEDEVMAEYMNELREVAKKFHERRKPQ